MPLAVLLMPPGLQLLDGLPIVQAGYEIHIHPLAQLPLHSLVINAAGNRQRRGGGGGFRRGGGGRGEGHWCGGGDGAGEIGDDGDWGLGVGDEEECDEYEQEEEGEYEGEFLLFQDARH